MQFPTVVFTHLPAGVLHTTSNGRKHRPSISLSVRSMRSSNPCPVPTPPFLSVVKGAFPLDFLTASSRLRRCKPLPPSRFCRRILRFLCASSAVRFRQFLDTSCTSIYASFSPLPRRFILVSILYAIFTRFFKDSGYMGNIIGFCWVFSTSSRVRCSWLPLGFSVLPLCLNYNFLELEPS